MVCIFAHPIITGKNPYYACEKVGWYNSSDCAEKAIQELTMYQNTGALQLIQVTTNKQP